MRNSTQTRWTFSVTRLSALLACLWLSQPIFAQEIQGLSDVAPVSADSMAQETESRGFLWYCLCSGTFTNQFTEVGLSSSGASPTSVNIDSISVAGDMSVTEEYIDFKLSSQNGYLRYQGVGDSSSYATYNYTGSQPSSLSQNSDGDWGFPVDISVPSAVSYNPGGMDPPAYWHLRINMTVTYDDGSTLSLGVGQNVVISVLQGEQQKLVVDVDPDQAARFSAMRIGTSGGSGEVDLFVGQGFVPTPYQNFTCSSDNAGNDEMCDLANPSGRYYASVYGFEASNEVSVYASGLGPPDAPVLSAADPEDLSAILRFSRPNSNGAAISSYSASCDLTEGYPDTLIARDAVTAGNDTSEPWTIKRMQGELKNGSADVPHGGILMQGPAPGVGARLPERLSIDLSEGVMEMKVTAARTTPSDNYFLTGEGPSGERFSMLLTPDGTAVGNVVSDDDTLLISASEQPGVSVMRSVAESGLKLIPYGDDFIAPDTNFEGDLSLEPSESTNSSTVDVMILLDPSLSQGTADYILQYTNDIYARSGTGLQFVATSFRSYSIGSNPLVTIANSGVVAMWRDTDRADFVAYLGPLDASYGYCGQAYVPGANNGSYSASVRSMGFSVNFVGTDGVYRCSDEVLAHEFGHNLGNLHDRANSGTSTPYRYYGYGDGIDGVYGTVMSYLSPEQGKFSSPNLTCAGNNPCGRYSYTNVAQAIDDVREIAAAVYSGSGGGGDPATQYVVTPAAGFGGTVSPASPRTVSDGGTISFTFSPESGYGVDAVSGTCSGALDGNTYTVTVSGADCSFKGTFTPTGKYYSVTVTANSGGLVEPLGVTRVVPFDSLPIDVQPSGGSSLAGIIHSCEGSYANGAFTAEAITSDCSVDVQFARTGSVVSGSGSPITVDQLSNGVEYACVVTATNSYGVSVTSNAIPVIPNIQYVAPGPPIITKVVGDDGEVSIFFTPGSTGNLSVTYTAECSESGPGSSSSPPTQVYTASGTSSPIRVSGLTNGVPVSCTVTAVNSEGEAVSGAVSGAPEELEGGLPVWLLYEATRP